MERLVILLKRIFRSISSKSRIKKKLISEPLLRSGKHILDSQVFGSKFKSLLNSSEECVNESFNQVIADLSISGLDNVKNLSLQSNLI